LGSCLSNLDLGVGNTFTSLNTDLFYKNFRFLVKKIFVDKFFEGVLESDESQKDVFDME